MYDEITRPLGSREHKAKDLINTIERRIKVLAAFVISFEFFAPTMLEPFWAT